MSSDSLAVFRKSLGPDLGALAEEHIKHDLQQSDRDALRKAASTVSVHTSVGSLIGVGLGIFLAYRLRSNRQAMFNAFKTADQPTAVKFAGGREEPIPNLTPILRPSALGDVATYTLLGAGGLFFGGESGLLTGTFRARQQINRDRESRERIVRQMHGHNGLLRHVLTLRLMDLGDSIPALPSGFIEDAGQLVGSG